MPIPGAPVRPNPAQLPRLGLFIREAGPFGTRSSRLSRFTKGPQFPGRLQLQTANGPVWVHGNATEHLAEYATANLNPGVAPGLVDAGTQMQLTSLQAAVEQATVGGVQYGKLLNVGGWNWCSPPPDRPGTRPTHPCILLK